MNPEWQLQQCTSVATPCSQTQSPTSSCRISNLREPLSRMAAGLPEAKPRLENRAMQDEATDQYYDQERDHCAFPGSASVGGRSCRSVSA